MQRTRDASVLNDGLGGNGASLITANDQFQGRGSYGRSLPIADVRVVRERIGGVAVIVMARKLERPVGKWKQSESHRSLRHCSATRRRFTITCSRPCSRRK